MSLLKNRAARSLLAAQTASATGDYAYMVALGVWLWSETGSALWVSASVLARTIPRLLLGTAAGRLADRVPRRRLLVAADVAMCAQMVGAAAAIAADAAPGVVVALVALVSVTGLPAGPATVKFLPELVDEHLQPRMNTAYEFSAQIAVFLGPALAAVLLASADRAWIVMLVNAASFAMSAGLRTRLPPGNPTGAGDDDDDAGAPLERGLRIARTSAATIAITIAVFMQTVQFGFEQAAFPILSTETLGLGDRGAATLFAALGIGGLVCAPLAARLAATVPAPTLLAATFAVEAVGVGVLGFRIAEAAALAAAFVAGVASFTFEVAVLGAVQRFVSVDVVGTFYGFLGAVASAGVLVGAFVLPAMTEVFTVADVVVASAVVSVAVALVVWRLTATSLPQHDVDVAAHGEEVRT